MTVNHISFLTRLGWLTIFDDAGKIAALEWGKAENNTATSLLKDAQKQLIEYLNRKRNFFDIPLNPHGTHFQQSVWHKLINIPYGETETYGFLAKRLESSPRAIGGACGKNPIPIFIPCHRVVEANKGLGGFSGGSGIQTKQALLMLESPVKNRIKE